MLIAELNEILAKATVDEGGAWKAGLHDNIRALFDSLPADIQQQLLLERDPHGNVQVSGTHKVMVIWMGPTSRCAREWDPLHSWHMRITHIAMYIWEHFAKTGKESPLRNIKIAGS